MTSSRAEHVHFRDLPDGRLACLVYDGSKHLLSYRYHPDHVREELLLDFAEVGRHIRQSGMVQLDDGNPHPPGVEVILHQVDDEKLSILRTFGLRFGWADGSHPHPLLQVGCRASLITPELIVQMNELVLPEACKLLRLDVPPPPAYRRR